MTYLGYVRAVVNQLPVESLANAAINWMDNKKLLENPSSTDLLDFNKQSINFVVYSIFCGVCTYFLYPMGSSRASLINASIGIFHLGIGFVERFRTTEPPEESPEKWKLIAMDLHKGFAHLLAAGYDFGIGFLLKQKYFGLISIVIFSFRPAIVLSFHQIVFKKPDTALDKPIEHQDDQQKQPSEKTFPTYLDKTCFIYIIAKKITLEFMPRIKPKQQDANKEQERQKDLLQEGVQVVKRILDLSGKNSLPEYGL